MSRFENPPRKTEYDADGNPVTRGQQNVRPARNNKIKKAKPAQPKGTTAFSIDQQLTQVESKQRSEAVAEQEAPRGRKRSKAPEHHPEPLVQIETRTTFPIPQTSESTAVIPVSAANRIEKGVKIRADRVESTIKLTTGQRASIERFRKSQAQRDLANMSDAEIVDKETAGRVEVDFSHDNLLRGLGLNKEATDEEIQSALAAEWKLHPPGDLESTLNGGKVNESMRRPRPNFLEMHETLKKLRQDANSDQGNEIIEESNTQAAPEVAPPATGLSHAEEDAGRQVNKVNSEIEDTEDVETNTDKLWNIWGGFIPLEQERQLKELEQSGDPDAIKDFMVQQEKYVSAIKEEAENEGKRITDELVTTYQELYDKMFLPSDVFDKIATLVANIKREYILAKGGGSIVLDDLKQRVEEMKARFVAEARQKKDSDKELINSVLSIAQDVERHEPFTGEAVSPLDEARMYIDHNRYPQAIDVLTQAVQSGKWSDTQNQALNSVIMALGGEIAVVSPASVGTLNASPQLSEEERIRAEERAREKLYHRGAIEELNLIYAGKVPTKVSDEFRELNKKLKYDETQDKATLAEIDEFMRQQFDAGQKRRAKGSYKADTYDSLQDRAIALNENDRRLMDSIRGLRKDGYSLPEELNPIDDLRVDLRKAFYSGDTKKIEKAETKLNAFVKAQGIAFESNLYGTQFDALATDTDTPDVSDRLGWKAKLGGLVKQVYEKTGINKVIEKGSEMYNRGANYLIRRTVELDRKLGSALEVRKEKKVAKMTTAEKAEYALKQVQKQDSALNKKLKELGSGTDAFVSKWGAKYNKLPLKAKVAFGLGMITGAIATGGAFAGVFAGIAGVQRAIGFAGSYARAKERVEKFTPQEGAALSDREKIRASLALATVQAAFISSTVGGTMYAGREFGLGEWLREQVGIADKPAPGTRAPAEAPAPPAQAPVVDEAGATTIIDTIKATEAGTLAQVAQGLELHELKASNYPEGSDAYRLITAEQGEVGRVADSIARARNIGNISAGSTMTFDRSGNISIQSPEHAFPNIVVESNNAAIMKGWKEFYPDKDFPGFDVASAKVNKIMEALPRDRALSPAELKKFIADMDAREAATARVTPQVSQAPAEAPKAESARPAPAAEAPAKPAAAPPQQEAPRAPAPRTETPPARPAAAAPAESTPRGRLEPSQLDETARRANLDRDAVRATDANRPPSAGLRKQIDDALAAQRETPPTDGVREPAPETEAPQPRAANRSGGIVPPDNSGAAVEDRNFGQPVETETAPVAPEQVGPQQSAPAPEAPVAPQPPQAELPRIEVPERAPLPQVDTAPRVEPPAPSGSSLDDADVQDAIRKSIDAPRQPGAYMAPDLQNRVIEGTPDVPATEGGGSVRFGPETPAQAESVVNIRGLEVSNRTSHLYTGFGNDAVYAHGGTQHERAIKIDQYLRAHPQATVFSAETSVDGRRVRVPWRLVGGKIEPGMPVQRGFLGKIFSGIFGASGWADPPNPNEFGRLIK